jgi:thiamine pyrophosphate-dependent acetolactate synthase large subunit-like protein
MSIGFSSANNDNPVISLVGDLSFAMNVQEIPNVRHLKTKNSFFVFNNHVPQNISADQLAEAKTTIQCDMPQMNLEGIAKWGSLTYVSIKTPDQLASWLKSADFANNNYLIDLQVPKDDNPLDE